LCITGDPPRMGSYPDATAVFDVDAIGLVNIVRNLNRGLDMGGNPIGAYGAAWDDSGLHSETFWLGWSTVAQYGWNPATAPLAQKGHVNCSPNLDMIRRMEPLPSVTMYPHDARARGLREGAMARVFNARGELRLPVRLDWGLKPGCVAITNGFWISEGGAVNLLSLGRETDMGFGAAFHDNAVQVEKA